MMWIIKNVFLRVYQIVGKLFLYPLLILEWKKPSYNRVNERPIEYGFAFKWLSNLCPSEVLDVGSGASSWPDVMAHCGFHTTACDHVKNYWKGRFFNRHYYVVNDDITKPKLLKQFDLITCISVLEHIPDHKAAIKGMFKLLKPGGYIILTIPYNETSYISNVYKLQGSEDFEKDIPYICQVYSRKELDDWLVQNKGEIINQEYYEIFDGDYWSFGKRIYPPRKSASGEKCHLTCVLIRKKP